MAFNTALSGIQAASADLSVIGNNIANSATTGFKESRAEFADVYASLLGASDTTIGSGVSLSKVSQQFNQGNIAFTNNTLDLAISGTGFFQLDAAGSRAYTRAGNFSIDKLGFIVNNEGFGLMAKTADSSGNITGAVAALQLDTTNVAPSATTLLNGTVNFDSRSAESDTAWALDANGIPVSAGYNSSTSTSVFDSLGNDHTSSLYFSKTATANEWNVRTFIDGVEATAGSPTLVTFNSDGTYNTPVANPTITWSPGGGAVAPQSYSLDLSTSTQYGSSFAVTSLNQDGFSSGQLLGVDINAEGVVFSRFSNGQSQAKGQIVLANFANSQGLQPLGDTTWAETFGSGAPILSEPGSAGLGLIQSNALEESNIDLTAQLVKLIVAQRNFQANAQTIQAEDAITQTIINLR